MKDRLTLGTKEQGRLVVLNRMERGEMRVREGAEVLGLSVRQVRRLVAGYRAHGAEALVQGNRGRVPPNRLATACRAQIVRVGTSLYDGANFSHLRDLLAEDGVVVSRATVRRIMREAGYRSPRSCRRRAHRRRRERQAQAGALVQIDGSPHAWLEDRGPRLSVLAALDDATGAILALVLREQEDSHGYFLLLAQLIRTHGVPLAVYHDRHGIFQDNTPRPETVAEQLAGSREPTQVGRALDELGITSIAARSPQAKGRVERLFRTLQERFRLALRLANACSVDEAQAAVPAFIAAYNARFAVPPVDPQPVYRPAPAPQELRQILCFRYERTVRADNTVRLGAHTLQIQPDRQRLSYAQARVVVHEHLDGALSVLSQGRVLLTQDAPPDAPTLRARAQHQRPSTAAAPAAARPAAPPPAPPGPPGVPAPSHPWRRLSLRHPTRVTKYG
jgi:transposase